MPAWLPPAIMAASSLLGGAQANKARRQEAAKNRRFQREMSNTAWQRGVADMEAAGINPALAYSHGGASSPGGSMASQEDVVSPAVSSGMQAKRLQADLQAIRATTEKLKAEGRSAKAVAAMAEARLSAYGIESLRVGKRDTLRFSLDEDEQNPFLKMVAAELDMVQQNARFARSKADIAAPAAELSENMGQWLPILALATKFNPTGLVSALRRKPTSIVKNFYRR